MSPARYPQSQVLNTYQLTHDLSSCGVTGIGPTQGGHSAQAWPLSVVQASRATLIGL